MAIYKKISNGLEMQGCDLYHYLLTNKGYCCEKGWNWEDLDTGQIMQGREWVKYWEQYGDPCSDTNVPTIVTPPVISGLVVVGNTLTSTTGVWYSDTGVTGYSYQWYRGASLISGATNTTYVTQQVDAGENITCQVIATDSDGSSLPSTSNILYIIDAEANAHYNRVIADGGTIPLGLTALNEFVVSVKNNYSVASVNTAMWALKPHWGISGIKTASGTGATAGGRATSVLYDICGVNGDFIQTTASAQPLALVHSGVNYAWLSGVISSNDFTTPTSVINQISGDLQIDVRFNLTNTSGVQTILSKWNTGSSAGTNSWGIVINDTSQTIGLYEESGSTIRRGLTTPITWVANTDYLFRFTSQVNDGSGQNVRTIQRSTDNGVSWVTLISSTTAGVYTRNTANTQPIKVGNIGNSFAPLQGIVYRATISNSIGGAPVVDFNPASYNRATSQTSWVSATGETWTLNTASTNNALKATIVDQTMIMGNGTSYGMRAPSLNINDTAITSYTVFRKFVNTAGGQIINELGANSTIAQGKFLVINDVSSGDAIVIRANTGLNASRFTSNSLSLKVATAINNIANANESSPYLVNNISQAFIMQPASDNNTTAMNATGYNFLARNNASSAWANVIATGDIVVKGEDDNTKRTAMYNLLKTLSNI